MTSNPLSRGRTRTLALAALCLVAAGGFAGALFWPDSSPAPSQARDQRNDPALPSGAAAAEELSQVRFPLAEADRRESMEAPALAAAADGRLCLAWASRTAEEEWTLFLARSSDGGQTFSSPEVFTRTPVHRVVSRMKGKEVAREVRMLPRLAAHGRHVVLGWVAATEDNTSFRYLVAASQDGGQTFLPPVAVHQSPEARPTFIGLAVDADGAVLCSWLDRRNGVQQVFASRRAAGAETFAPEARVWAGRDDKGVCPCCPTTALLTPQGDAIVAFRNQEGGYRDMWIARAAGEGAFGPPVAVSAPRWRHDGCPHDGPALTMAGERLFTAWMDASGGLPHVFLAAAAGNMHAVADPIAVPAEQAISQGHPALAAAGQSLVMAWDESEGTVAKETEAGEGHSHAAPLGGRRIMLADWTGAGLTAPRAVAPMEGAFQERPALAMVDSRTLCIAWSELSLQGKSIVVTKMTVPSAAPRLAHD